MARNEGTTRNEGTARNEGTLRRIPTAKTASVAFNNGAQGKITVASQAVLEEQNNFTYECWFKANDLAGTYDPIFGRGGNVNGGFACNIFNSDGQIRIFYNGGVTFSDTGFYPRLNRWNHIVCTHNDSDELNVYFNGSAPYTDAAVSMAAGANLETWIGVWTGFTTFRLDGGVALFRYWNRELSSAEARNLYGMQVPRDNLQLELLLEDGAGNPTDSSGNGFDGVLGAGASWSTDFPNQFGTRTEI